MTHCTFPSCACDVPATCSRTSPFPTTTTKATMTTKAQRLAEELLFSWSDEAPSQLKEKAAAELRRLDANEAALLEALEFFAHGEYRKEVVELITRIEAERDVK